MNVNVSIPDPCSEVDNKFLALLHALVEGQNQDAQLACCVADWRRVDEAVNGLLRAL